MKKIISFIMVVVMTLGMTLSVQATENTMDENNLYGQPFRIIDQNGNVMITGRLGISNPTIPVGAGAEWDVNVVTGNNTMSVGVTPAANLQLQVTNSVGIPQYTYNSTGATSYISSVYISPASGRGRYRVWNKSSYTITITQAMFNGN